jgi:hypothetical protein
MKSIQSITTSFKNVHCHQNMITYFDTSTIHTHINDISKFIFYHGQITQTIPSKDTRTAQDIFLTGKQSLTKKSN